MNALYVGWGRPSAWGEALGADLGARVIFTGATEAPARVFDRAPLRYWWDLKCSLKAIGQVRPDLLIWQVPPSLGPIVIHGGWRRSKVPWGLDIHSGAINLARWRWLLPALRRTARTAIFTVVHNDEIASMIQPWPSPITVVDNYVVSMSQGSLLTRRTSDGPIVVAASGGSDEPLKVVVMAAGLLGDEYKVVITGRDTAVRKRIGDISLPKNVHLTDFLPRRDYIQLLATASITVCLTVRSATMQLGAWEAGSLGCPVIISDHAVLRRYFREGAEFVDNEPGSLVDAIRLIKANYGAYLESAARMATTMRAERERQISNLREQLRARFRQAPS